MTENNKNLEKRCCKTCLHMEASHHRKDGICMPQMFLATEPKAVYDNEPCEYYEQAPGERISNIGYGIQTKEVWNSEKGDYVPADIPLKIPNFQ